MEAISQAGDRLEELERHVVLDELVKVAEGIWRAQGEPKGPGGRKRWSSEVMLRVFCSNGSITSPMSRWSIS